MAEILEQFERCTKSCVEMTPIVIDLYSNPRQIFQAAGDHFMAEGREEKSRDSISVGDYDDRRRPAAAAKQPRHARSNNRSDVINFSCVMTECMAMTDFTRRTRPKS